MLKIFLFCFIQWLVLSGTELNIYLILGIITCFFSTLLILHLDIKLNISIKINQIIPFVKYIIWLLWQNILSSIFFVKLAWTIKSNFKGSIVKIPIKEIYNISDTKKIIFTNSVTFTPGTCTIFIDETYIYIHAINKDISQGIYDTLAKVSAKL